MKKHSLRLCAKHCCTSAGLKKIVIFLDFHSTKQGLILGHVALAIPRTRYIPQHVIKARWKVA